MPNDRAGNAKEHCAPTGTAIAHRRPDQVFGTTGLREHR